MPKGAVKWITLRIRGRIRRIPVKTQPAAVDLGAFGQELSVTARSRANVQIGFAGAHTMGKSARLDVVGVSPKFRKRGLGQRLVTDLADVIRKEAPEVEEISGRIVNPAAVRIRAKAFKGTEFKRKEPSGAFRKITVQEAFRATRSGARNIFGFSKLKKRKK